MGTRARFLVMALVLLVGIIILAATLPRPSTGSPVVVYDPYLAEGRWYKGQLHCHTIESDGEYPPDQVLSIYRALGFEFVALTDHNQVTLNGSSDMLVLGQEYGKGSTESSGSAHMVGLNISSAPDPLTDDQDRVNNISEQGGVTILCHPNADFIWTQEDIDRLSDYAGLEIFNGKRWSSAVDKWDAALTAGKRVWGFANDDAHHRLEFGRAWTMVRISGELSTDSVLDALRRGSFYASTGPTFSSIAVENGSMTVTSPEAEWISFIGSGGKVLSTIHGTSASYRFLGTEGYVRAEAVNSSSGIKTAWLQPVFVANSDGQLTEQHPTSSAKMMTSRSGCSTLI